MTHKELADRREAMREYKASGKTNKEVAEHFNVQYHYAKIVCRGIAPQRVKGKEKEWTAAFEKLHGEDWEVVGQFISVDDFIDIKCKHCGAIRHYPCASVRKGYIKAECFECNRTKRIQREKEKKSRQEYRLIEIELKAKLKAEEERQKEATKWHKCLICGKLTNRPKYCSDICSNRHQWRKKEIKRRSLIKKQIVDTDITLEKLYEIENGVCWLCGTKCDWNDYEYQGKWFIAGNFYPSIEHVKPISKGGTHSWDNVRLAHRICNSIKGDN